MGRLEKHRAAARAEQLAFAGFEDDRFVSHTASLSMSE
jgi:hypothetical protein